jgi:hypothetical protein
MNKLEEDFCDFMNIKFMQWVLDNCDFIYHNGVKINYMGKYLTVEELHKEFKNDMDS